MSDPIILDAREILNIFRKIPAPEETKPSAHWESVLDHRHRVVIRDFDSAESLIRRATNEDFFTFPVPPTNPVFSEAVRRFKKWFAIIGKPLDEIDEILQETPYAADGVLFTESSRRCSIAFLWHLAILHRVAPKIPQHGRILEIGGGYGGLARLTKLAFPSCRYIIVDMAESLFFSYVFLRKSLPGARVVWATKAEEAANFEGQYDFLLISNQFIEHIKGQEVDLVINTQSLSEMRQVTYDRFVQLIQDELSVRWFYNCNRYGPHPDGLNWPGRMQDGIGADGVSSASALDSHWKLLYWNLYREDNIGRCYVTVMTTLELLVERIPPQCRNLDQYARMAELMVIEANRHFGVDDYWHQMMWNAIRYDPQPTSIKLYAEVLKLKGFQQAAHYERLLRRKTI